MRISHGGGKTQRGGGWVGGGREAAWAEALAGAKVSARGVHTHARAHLCLLEVVWAAKRGEDWKRGKRCEEGENDGGWREIGPV